MASQRYSKKWTEAFIKSFVLAVPNLLTYSITKPDPYIEIIYYIKNLGEFIFLQVIIK